MTKIKNFFKSITNSKKKIFALALSVCVVVLSIAGSSIAYFTDTEQYTNTFTSGNVDITLKVNTEVTDDDTLALGPDRVIPGKSIPKATSITVKTGSENAYLAAVITVSNPGNIFNGLNIEDFINGLDKTNATVTVVSHDDGAGTIIDYTIFVVFTNAVAAEGTVNVFSSIVPPATWEQSDMENLGGLNVKVVAYAVQAEGFTNAKTALKTAFATEFNELP